MSPGLQPKLLRALQERAFERVGDNQPIRVDVRVIAATNSDVDQMVKDGTFREDLFYRLNVIPIRLPPLRERREDIPLLVSDFLQDLGSALEPPRGNVIFSQEAMRRLMAFRWPGNVRQLENMIERLLILTPGRRQIDVDDLPVEISADKAAVVSASAALPETGLDLQRHLRDTERTLIQNSLERTGGNKQQAARLLNIKRTTLIEKAKRLGLN